MSPTEAFDPRRSTLGEILVRFGVISQEQLSKALEECDPEQKTLGQVLVAMGYATEEKILKALGIRLGIPYFTTFEGILDPAAARLIPETVARRHLAVPVFVSEGVLTVGMVNPVDIDAIDDFVRHSSLRIQPVATTLANIFASIQQAYSAKPPPASEPSPEEAAREVRGKVARFQAEEISVIEIVTGLFQEGMARRASDIHLEPAEKLVRVRYRVDGMLQEGKTFTKELEVSLVARIKILAKMDITETRLPQDGHLRFDYGGSGIDVRVSTLPTVHGEKIVARLLDTSQSLKRLADLGMDEQTLKPFATSLKNPNGVVLVTGPTGSGKTTTLYAALADLNESTRNIVTLEDPVEYRIDRLNQVETHSKIGLTFAAGLRSILRQDPNVILVGEIRDLETAEIALQAAITGHLVLSTLHTNDAVASIHRLINMRAEPFMVAEALRGVLAQRLLRRLCRRCRKPHKLLDAEIETLGRSLPKTGGYLEPAGCELCAGTGYAGRLAVHEWLTIDRELREMILRRASADEIAAAARKAGLRNLLESALEKASSGETSITEVIRMTRVAAEA